MEVHLESVREFREAVRVAFDLIFKETNKDMSSTVYRILHLTATFLICVLYRRVTKREEDLSNAFARDNIHKHYYDMVPNPFGVTIPSPPKTLNKSVEAALSTNTDAGRHFGTMIMNLMQTSTTMATDNPVGFLDQTQLGIETILKATCMTHIAGAGLPLITLFLTLKSVYCKTERETLEWLSYPELISCLRKVVKVRKVQYELLRQKKSVKLFPYCRLIHQKYHTDLGYRGNESICYLMASLIDIRTPPKQGSGACNALWTRSLSPQLKKDIELAANQISSITSGFTLTPAMSGQITFKGAKSSGVRWEPPKPQTREPQPMYVTQLPSGALGGTTSDDESDSVVNLID